MSGAVATRIDVLKGVMRDKMKVVDEGIALGVKVDGSNVDVPQETKDAIDAAFAEMKEAKSEIDKLMGVTEYKAFLDAPVDGGGPSGGSGLVLPGSAEYKSIGERLVESDEFKYMMSAGKKTMDAPMEIQEMDLPGMGQKDVYTGLVNTSGLSFLGFGSRQRDPMVPRRQRAARVRDLFPVVGTNSNLIDYFRVLGFSGANPASGGAASVRERAAADGISAPTGGATDVFGLKPRSALAFSAAQAPVRTIAHYEVAHRNVLDDEPQLTGTINNELMYGLQIEEDRQILSGSGANEELLGILNTPGIQGYTQADLDPGAGVQLEPKSDTLRRAQTKVILAYYNPTGYVLHPNDWEDIELQKASGDGQYMLFSNISIGAASQVWRTPVVETPAIPEGTFLTGAFGLAAQLYDRQLANVRVAEQHADFFVRNAVAILAEERLALAVKRPEAFVKGTFLN